MNSDINYLKDVFERVRNLNLHNRKIMKTFYWSKIWLKRYK